MEFARLETQDEMDYIFGQMTLLGAASYAMHVDGVATIPGQKTGWFWVRNRLAISYDLGRITAGQS